MIVTSAGIVGGKYLDKYGKRGVKNEFGMPVLSPPVKIEGAKEGTVSYALYMEDEDAIPVCGYSFTHWLAADVTTDDIPEGASGKGLFPEGQNDYGSDRSGGDCARYGGMGPPNAPHLYQLHVYALDSMTGLKKGFSLEEFLQAIEGRVLDEYTLNGVYDN